MLCDICHCSISDTRKNTIFVLVYNEAGSDLKWETKRLIGASILSGKSPAVFDLDKAAGFLVSRILVLTKVQFENKLVPKLKGL